MRKTFIHFETAFSKLSGFPAIYACTDWLDNFHLDVVGSYLQGYEIDFVERKISIATSGNHVYGVMADVVDPTSVQGLLQVVHPRACPNYTYHLYLDPPEGLSDCYRFEVNRIYEYTMRGDGDNKWEHRMTFGFSSFTFDTRERPPFAVPRREL